ncbi:transposase family protein [Streptomyces sp. NPDC056831]|uniref:transposase family protein n=1 Tax=Streptomyces sp. NPDC056831 TaxID=3345954 RepID=UPI0036D0E572
MQLARRLPAGQPTLADKGYIGAGIGIRVPVRRLKGQSEQALHADTRATNALIRNVRALGERTAAELKQRWRTLQHVTLSPSRIGDITRRPRPQQTLEAISAEKTSLTGPFFPGRVLSCDQSAVRVRSLIQIIEARRCRPAR